MNNPLFQSGTEWVTSYRRTIRVQCVSTPTSDRRKETIMEDLIKRSDAIEAVWKPQVKPNELIFDALKTAIESEINNVPSADRPQGKWIDAEIPLESGGSMPIQVCNLCKTFYPLAYTGGGHRFCPNCGARMKGADDE